MGGAHPKNTDQIINIGTIGPASAEDTCKTFRRSKRCPGKKLKFEILKLLEMH